MALQQDSQAQSFSQRLTCSPRHTLCVHFLSASFDFWWIQILCLIVLSCFVFVFPKFRFQSVPVPYFSTNPCDRHLSAQFCTILTRCQHLLQQVMLFRSSRPMGFVRRCQHLQWFFAILTSIRSTTRKKYLQLNLRLGGCSFCSDCVKHVHLCSHSLIFSHNLATQNATVLVEHTFHRFRRGDHW